MHEQLSNKYQIIRVTYLGKLPCIVLVELSIDLIREYKDGAL